jgi:hypothetical protein
VTFQGSSELKYLLGQIFKGLPFDLCLSATAHEDATEILGLHPEHWFCFNLLTLFIIGREKEFPSHSVCNALGGLVSFVLEG